jgi:hypothetical protein
MPQIDASLLDDTIESLEWMTTDAQLRFNEIRGNLEDGSQGGYSPELTKALKTLEQLKIIAG